MGIWILDSLSEAGGGPTEDVVGLWCGEADLLSRVGPVDEVCCNYGGRNHFFIGFEGVVDRDEQVEG